MAEKAIMWVNAAWKVFSGFPTRVQEDVIDAFTTIRSGGLPVHAKPMHGLDGGVFEIAIRHRKDAWRVVYAMKIGEQIWIIHAFQKKSKSGSTTPRQEIEAIGASDNLFRDFNIPNADLRNAKATLAGWIMKALDDQGLSTRDAEARTGIAHSEFSRIRNVKLTRFTLDRLFVIFAKLEPGAEISVKLVRP